MRRLLVITLALLLTGCGSDPFADEQERLREEEMIYRIVLDSLLAAEDGRVPVLIEPTRPAAAHGFGENSLLGPSLRFDGDLFRSTRRDFERRNQVSRPLQSLVASYSGLRVPTGSARQPVEPGSKRSA